MSVKSEVCKTNISGVMAIYVTREKYGYHMRITLYTVHINDTQNKQMHMCVKCEVSNTNISGVFDICHKCTNIDVK